MSQRFRARPGRLLALALAAAAFCAAFGSGVAYAADQEADPLSFEQVFLQLQNTPVYKDACTKTCHGNIAQTKNYSSAIKFSHGYHQLVACSSCHPRFPHRKDATIERPTMKGCFDCHGVRHGPMGVLASGACPDCHVTERSRLRPAFHGWDWAQKPHVAPANKEFNSKCAMCHTPDTCTECHDREGIVWSPEKWDYNAGDGCQACHGNAGLTKQVSMGLKSFEVRGVSDSAHQEITCQDCHTDYRYDDQKMASPLWNINAGQACATCHAKQKDKKLSSMVADYNQSVHAQQIAKGSVDSATCASCHGGHFIYRLDTPAAKARMQASSYRTCARCKQHGADYDTYDDYYHGKAYKAGNADAPACWDCHESHKVLPAADPKSSVYVKNIGGTCGQEGCHKGSNEKFGESAAKLIHQKVKEQEKNPLRSFLANVFGR